MKNILFIIIIVFSFTFKQQTRNVILVFEDNNIKKENNQISFYLNDTILFSFNEEKHLKTYVDYEDISQDIVGLKDYKKHTSLKFEDKKHVEHYKGQVFKIFVYIKNQKCENEGVLYEVERLIPLNKEVN